ncbi:calcyphosin-2-like isoform X2 [Watersipora subatra]|uniref:calcyphosin-2-like isoform X2 n=1 Tax=Watersipora subatra TaxID=2589382 RepID=UPI00355C39B6
MENRRRGRAPGSGRPSSRFNPITGVDYEENDPHKAAHEVGVNGQGDAGIPSLDLGVLEDPCRRVPTQHSHHQHKLGPPSPSSTISWGTADDTARSLLSNRFINLEDEYSHTPAAPRDDDGVDRDWTDIPYLHRTQEKIIDANDLEEKKRREKILETVMADQLSRAVISDPSQESGRSGDGDKLYHQPGQPRGAIRRLHQSKVKTSGTATEHLLSQRVRFSARIITRVPTDAVRELTGFFFYAENSLTIYEYKQFGRISKALPLITRGVYNRVVGRRKGEPYTLSDIRSDNTLYFPVGGQKCLPETARQVETLAVRICEVDEDAKADIILSGVRGTEQLAAWNKFHELTEAEYGDLAITKSVQEKIQFMLKKRGVRTTTGLFAHLRGSDRNGDGMLDRFELQQALKDFHIVLTDQAFQKMDPQRAGVVSFPSMRKFFNAAKHPWVKSGQLSEIGLTEQFLASWSHCVTLEQISYLEFEEYYEGLSIGIESDDEFINILKNCWGL